MKFINIFAAISSVALAFTLVGCEDQPETYLDSISVSSSYVTLPKAGGSNEITITTSSDWVLSDAMTGKTQNFANWYTVTPTSGSAGKTTIKFSAGASEATNTQVIYLVSGDEVQDITVFQYAGRIDKVSTCAEIIAGPDSKTYRAQGTVSAIANTTYGNWYLKDDTGEVYIYGTLDADGAEKNFSSLGIEVGDIVTVEGPKTTYGTTVELVNVTVLNIKKALVQLEQNSVTVAKAGGEVSVGITVKGDGVSVETSASWLHYLGVYNGKVHFSADANDGAPRSATVTLKSELNGAETELTLQVDQEGSLMTFDEFFAADNDSPVALEGLVVATYKRGVVITDGTAFIQVYANAEVSAKIGDKVQVSGKRGAYNNLPQLASPVVTVVSSNNKVTYPEPIVVDDDTDLDNFKANPYVHVVYIQYTGVLSVSGNYLNVKIDGVTPQGSIQYPYEDYSALNGKTITVRGFLSGGNTSKYINTMAVSVEEVK